MLNPGFYIYLRRMVDTGGLGQQWFNQSHMVSGLEDRIELMEKVTTSPKWLGLEETLEIVSQGHGGMHVTFHQPHHSLF